MHSSSHSWSALASRRVHEVDHALPGGLVRVVIRRFGEWPALTSGLVFGAIGFVVYGLAPNGTIFWIGVPIVSLWGFTGAAVNGLMTRHVQPNEQGQLQGANNSLRGIAGLFGPGIHTSIFASFIGDRAGWHLPGALLEVRHLCRSLDIEKDQRFGGHAAVLDEAEAQGVAGADRGRRGAAEEGHGIGEARAIDVQANLARLDAGEQPFEQPLTTVGAAGRYMLFISEFLTQTEIISAMIAQRAPEQGLQSTSGSALLQIGTLLANDSDDWRLYAAQQTLDAGGIDGAQRIIDQISTTSPFAPDAEIVRASIQIERGNDDAAAAAAQRPTATHRPCP